MEILKPNSRIIVTGVLTPTSLGWQVAELALDEGAQVVATYNPRHEKHALAAIEILANDLREKGMDPARLQAIGVDITDAEQLDGLDRQLAQIWGEDYEIDGVVHSVAFGPKSTLGQGFLGVSWEDVSVAVQTSAYSLPAIVQAVKSRLSRGAGIVAITFDAKMAWPSYSWMGVAKGALESAVRYLARELGEQQVRVNAVAAGPVYTVASNAIPGFADMAGGWSDKAPLGWDCRNPRPVAQSVITLLGPWLCGTTGEILHVDGGYHSQGA